VLTPAVADRPVAAAARLLDSVGGRKAKVWWASAWAQWPNGLVLLLW
jgi:hypothetical protein